MLGKFCFLLLTAFLTAALSTDKNWWDRKPLMEWSETEAARMLHDSPWVSLTSAAVRPRGVNGRRLQTWYYRVRLPTARPVREAMLRLVALFGSPGVVRFKDLGGGRDPEQSRLDEFVASNPDYVWVRGDDQYIVVGLTLVSRIQRFTFEEAVFEMFEDAHSEELTGLRLSDVAEHTTLSTDTGKRIPLLRYEPPGRNTLGAHFYFHRTLSDGSLAFSANDGDLVLETQIQGKNLQAKFDLKKMVYKGKLEM